MTIGPSSLSKIFYSADYTDAGDQWDGPLCGEFSGAVAGRRVLPSHVFVIRSHAIHALNG
jgi:hypothetical protein